MRDRDLPLRRGSYLTGQGDRVVPVDPADFGPPLTTENPMEQTTDTFTVPEQGRYVIAGADVPEQVHTQFMDLVASLNASAEEHAKVRHAAADLADAVEQFALGVHPDLHWREVRDGLLAIVTDSRLAR
jgi:hypothetical protein